MVNTLNNEKCFKTECEDITKNRYHVLFSVITKISRFYLLGRVDGLVTICRWSRAFYQDGGINSAIPPVVGYQKLPNLVPNRHRFFIQALEP